MRKMKFKIIRLSKSALFLTMIFLVLIQLTNIAPSGKADVPVRTDISVHVANDMI
ncbi:unnamed protein product, partial [marine sediment metagenome]